MQTEESVRRFSWQLCILQQERGLISRLASTLGSSMEWFDRQPRQVTLWCMQRKGHRCWWLFLRFCQPNRHNICKFGGISSHLLQERCVLAYHCQYFPKWPVLPRASKPNRPIDTGIFVFLRDPFLTMVPFRMPLWPLSQQCPHLLLWLHEHWLSQIHQLDWWLRRSFLWHRESTFHLWRVDWGFWAF